MPDETPVLIAGAGPAGLAAAITLARHGIDSVLVERRAARGDHPRATGISTRSMELLRAWGLERDARAGAVEVEWVGRAAPSLATMDRGQDFPLGMPTRAEAAALSPTSPACIPQDHLEPVLAREVRRLGRTHVVRGAEVVGVEDTGGAVRAWVRHTGRGVSRAVRARWVVAADGMRSTIRSALGIAAPGVDGLEHRLSVLFRAPLWPLVGAHRHGLYMITHPEADVALLPAGRGDRWIYAVSYDPGIEAPGDFGPERLTRMLRLATGDPALAPRYESVAGVTFGAHLAERFREGRVLLVGDAAHRVTPRGGTGLNSALKGGVDVGWKLAWILSGWAPEALIDTYETERRPVVQHNLERSIDPEGSIREPGAEIAADLGGRVKHVWTEGRSTVDLLGPGYTLFAAPAAPGRPRGIPAGPPVKRVALDPGAARELGLGTAGTLLARPDGVPVGLWPGAASGLAGPQGVLGHERVVVGVEAADDLPADALEGHAV